MPVALELVELTPDECSARLPGGSCCRPAVESARWPFRCRSGVGDGGWAAAWRHETQLVKLACHLHVGSEACWGKRRDARGQGGASRARLAPLRWDRRLTSQRQ